MYLAPKQGLSLESMWKGLLWTGIKEPFYEDGLDLTCEDTVPLTGGLDHTVLGRNEALLPPP